MASWVRNFKGLDAALNEGVEVVTPGSVAEPEHCDASSCAGREADWVGEVDVEGDENSGFGDGCRKNVWVARAGHLFVPDGVHVVTGAAKLLGPSKAQVLVELQLHATST